MIIVLFTEWALNRLNHVVWMWVVVCIFPYFIKMH